jgi:hypothetical protein
MLKMTTCNEDAEDDIFVLKKAMLTRLATTGLVGPTWVTPHAM